MTKEFMNSVARMRKARKKEFQRMKDAFKNPTSCCWKNPTQRKSLTNHFVNDLCKVGTVVTKGKGRKEVKDKGGCTKAQSEVIQRASGLKLGRV